MAREVTGFASAAGVEDSRRTGHRVCKCGRDLKTEGARRKRTQGRRTRGGQRIRQHGHEDKRRAQGSQAWREERRRRKGGLMAYHKNKTRAQGLAAPPEDNSKPGNMFKHFFTNRAATIEIE